MPTRVAAVKSAPHACCLRLHTSEHQRYALAKFIGYCQYAERTRLWRHALAIVLTPLPSLALSLLAPLIPLQDPLRGVRANTGFLLNYALTMTLVVVGCLLQIRASCGLSHRDFSHADVLVIGVFNGILAAAIVVAAAFIWRFPIPFSIVVLFAPLFVVFLLTLVLVLRGRLTRRDSAMRGPVLAFLLPFSLQASQVVLYPAFASVFAASSTQGQVVLIALFPFLKHGFRTIVRRLTRHLPEDGNESAVSGVEIAAAMYQSALMQNTPSPVVTALLMGIDIGQTLVSIFVVMAKSSTVQSNEIVCRAVVLISEQKPDREKLFQTRPATPVKIKGHPSSVHPNTKDETDASVSSPVVQHALEILHNAETLVLVEYFEVVLPAMNAVFLCIASQLSSAEYNPKLRLYRHRPMELQHAMATLVLYTGLQGLSLVVLHVIMWRRYQVSTTTLLAYLLERHAWAIQGKLISWPTLVFQLPVLHYGFDFTFRFDFSLPPLP